MGPLFLLVEMFPSRPPRHTRPSTARIEVQIPWDVPGHDGGGVHSYFATCSWAPGFYLLVAQHCIMVTGYYVHLQDGAPVPHGIISKLNLNYIFKELF